MLHPETLKNQLVSPRADWFKWWD